MFGGYDGKSWETFYTSYKLKQFLKMQTGELNVAGKLPGRKGPGGVGRQRTEYEPVACPGSQEGQPYPGLYQN